MDSVDSMDTSIQPYTVYGFAYSQNEIVQKQNHMLFSIAEYRLSILSILSTTTTTPFLSSTERLEVGVWTVEWTVGGQDCQLSTVHCACRTRSWRFGMCPGLTGYNCLLVIVLLGTYRSSIFTALVLPRCMFQLLYLSTAEMGPKASISFVSAKAKTMTVQYRSGTSWSRS